MRVLWTPRAASDLKRAVDYISEDKPDAAAGVAARIYRRVMDLESTPHVGRLGAVRGTRELIFPPWQWVVVYKVDEQAVKILRIRQTSRRWP